MGGVVIWGSVFLTVGLIAILGMLFPQTLFADLDYFSRSQTWIPLSVLALGAAFGFLNDFYDVTHGKAGVRLRTRIIVISIVAALVGWWFYTKLGVNSIGLPFAGELTIGWLIIPFFLLLTNALYASGVIDGIDGLWGECLLRCLFPTLG